MTIAERVKAEVERAPVVDIHTHLFAPQFGTLNLSGIDELLTYHYLVAETLRAEPSIAPEQFYRLSKPMQADFVWDVLFRRGAPVSEATAGVVNVLTAFGLNPRSPDLSEARRFFAAQEPNGHLDRVLELAGVFSLAMTNDPLDPQECALWDQVDTIDPRFHTALRLDRLIHDSGTSGQAISELGLGTGLDGARRFIDLWIDRMRPRYLAVSLPPRFCDGDGMTTLKQAVLPACVDSGFPCALMVGVRRAVNPRLGGAGDGMGIADITLVERLAAEFPGVRFFVTVLARENVQPLCVAARKFANILPFGCWWFLNNPSLVEETTLLRLEMLGTTFVPQHSDARVLEQLIYKWNHARRAIAAALVRRYEHLATSGWTATDLEIRRDVTALLSGNALGWLGL